MSITMSELAALAGVSQSTVSLVLNGKTHGRITKENQEKVLTLAKKHNYRLNMAAKGLRMQKQYNIGVIMPMPCNPFYSNIVSMLQSSLAAHGYMALFSFWGEKCGVREAFEAVFQHNAAGVIAWDYDECLLSEGVPAVLYNNEYQGLDSVMLDFEASSRKTLEYLYKLGHRKIAYFGHESDRRCVSTIGYMKQLGLQVNPEWIIPSKTTLAAGHMAMQALLTRKDLPTAIICQNDSIAAAAVFHSVRSGYRVPEDFSVVGFDNIDESAFCLPPITTFDIQGEKLTGCLIDLLMKRLADPDRKSQCIRIKPKFIQRESCGKVNPVPEG